MIQFKLSIITEDGEFHELQERLCKITWDEFKSSIQNEKEASADLGEDRKFVVPCWLQLVFDFLQKPFESLGRKHLLLLCWRALLDMMAKEAQRAAKQRRFLCLGPAANTVAICSCFGADGVTSF